MDTPREEHSSHFAPRSSSDFFAQSPFRSGYFTILFVVCSTVVLFDIYVLLFHWGHLSTAMAAAFFIFGLQGAIVPMISALQTHSRIHDLYLARKIKNTPLDSPMCVVLTTMSDVMQAGLVYQFSTLLALLIVLFHFGVK